MRKAVSLTRRRSVVGSRHGAGPPRRNAPNTLRDSALLLRVVHLLGLSAAQEEDARAAGSHGSSTVPTTPDLTPPPHLRFLSDFHA